MIALQSTLQNLISNHHNGGGVRKKDDDEYIHTVVVSANDEFVFCQVKTSLIFLARRMSGEDCNFRTFALSAEVSVKDQKDDLLLVCNAANATILIAPT